jgi:hypothetical protein
VSKIFLFGSVFIFFTACVSIKQQQPVLSAPIGELKLLDIYEIPYNLSFKSTTVGGLSGIDLDEKNNQYYFISDDRSSTNPARFYSADIRINNQKIDTIVFKDMVVLKDEKNQPYPSFKENPAHTVDPEAMRFYPNKNRLIWSSEGERIVSEKDTILTNPSIFIMDQQGNRKDSFRLPPNLYMRAAEKGPRQNGVLEGMSFFDGYKRLMVNVEEPLYEDGPKAALIPNNAFIRFFEFNVRNKKNTAQYAYELEAVAHLPNPVDGFKVNGVSDILNLGNQQWLVLERSFSSGRLACTIKIFLADFTNATNIAAIASLKNNKEFIPIKKQLLLNMDSLGVFTDNIEGICWGPRLANGHRSLLLVSDNNFKSFQKSQLFLLEIIPKATK